MRKSTLWLFLAAVIVASAQTLTTLATFDKTNGLHPFDGLVQGLDGNFYGTTHGDRVGRTFYAGTVFRVTPSGTLTTVHDVGTAYPYAGLLLAADGSFYGTTERHKEDYNRGLIFQVLADGAFTKLRLSPGGTTAPLIQAVDGDFYGVTGTSIFKFTSGGAPATLYTFCASDPCPGGRAPWAGLVQASDGNFYGTTSQGGSSTILDAGTVFRMNPAGDLTPIYSFCAHANCADGANPYAGLIQATDGNLYGTTVEGGGSTNCGPGGCGTVFKVSLTAR
jgi:uncharacterized repeat protein (TIGR03803 family)